MVRGSIIIPARVPDQAVMRPPYGQDPLVFRVNKLILNCVKMHQGSLASRSDVIKQ